MKTIFALFGFIMAFTAISDPSRADSALQPGSVQSFGSVFSSHTQEMRKEAEEAAAVAKSSIQPNLLAFYVVKTRNDVVSNYLFWNSLALETSGRDHIFVMADPTDPCSGSMTYEQLGPHRSSRAMAIVHVAMFEVVNSVNGKFDGYLNATPPDITGIDKDSFLNVAIGVAAAETLSALYPRQKDAWIRLKLEQYLLQFGSGKAAEEGTKFGRAVARAVLEKRKQDGANVGGVEGKPVPEPVLVPDTCNPSASPFVFKGAGPTFWRQDPVSRLNVALGANWGRVVPFAMRSGDQFRLPAINIADPGFNHQVEEVKSLGAAGIERGPKSVSTRTATDEMKGIFWAYDGVPSLCAPPTLYNQVVRAVLDDESTKKEDIDFVSRLFALANVAMADAAIAAWDSKYFHQVARPVTYIRDTDGSPSDGDTCTGKDCHKACGGEDGKWCPLGAPATNGRGPNFTPPFPSYPSGHATFGGALFRVLDQEFGGDRSFAFTSDEFNGSNRPAGEETSARPNRPQSWGSLRDAEYENGRSRIWLGIHWQADADAGIAQGHCVADWTLANMFRPKGSAAPPAPVCDYSAL